MALTRVLNNTGNPIIGADGDPLASAVITFQLVDAAKRQPIVLFDATDAGGDLVVGNVVTATTDESGIFSTELWCNNRGEIDTLYKVRLPAGVAGGAAKPFYIRVTEGDGSVTLLAARTAMEALQPQTLSLFEALLTNIIQVVATISSVVTTTTNGIMSFVDKIRFDLVWGEFIRAANYTTLEDADAAAVDAGKRLIISSAWAVVPATLTSQVEIFPGGKLDGSGTVTINGRFKGCDGCFGTSQTVIFGSGTADEIYPELWVGTDAEISQKALDCFVASPVNLTFRPRSYSIDTALGLTVASNSVQTKRISGFGTTLVDALSVDGDLLKIQANAPVNTAVVRNMKLEGFLFRGESHAINLLVLDGNSGADQEYLYGMQLDHMKFEGGTTWGATGATGSYNGLKVTGDTFELTLLECNARAQNNTVGYGLYFINSSPSNLSSITVLDCMTDGFREGLYVPSPTSDVRVIGGTYIRAQRFGVELGNFTGVLSNVHAENNWVSAANQAAGNAGIKVSGQGAVIGCYGINIGNQKYVVSAYAASGGVILLISNFGIGVTKTLLLQAADNTASFTLLGNQTYDTTGSPRMNTMDATRSRMNMTSGTIQPGITVTAGAPTVTPNPLLGNVFRIVLQNNATVANVDASFTPDPGDEIEFIFQQGGAGGGYSVSWGTNYRVGTWSPVTTLGKFNSIRFRWFSDGSAYKWTQIASAVGA